MVRYQLATDEQKALAAKARSIMEEYLVPHVSKLEKGEDGLGQYPLDVHQKIAEAGFYGMNIPKKWGGPELDVVTQAVITEEMAQVETAFTFSNYNMGTYFPLILMTGLSDEEKQDFANRILSGEAKGAFCVTEPDAGSDAAAMQTTAVKDGDEWVLNGTKCWVSNATVANFFLVAAWTDKTQRASKGVTFFLVEKERGVQPGRKESKMGLKLSETAEIILSDVRVPDKNVIGEVGRGFVTSMEVISTEGRAIGSAFNLGIAQAALDAAIDYAKTARRNGKRLIDHQRYAFMIANMEARTSAARALMFETLVCQREGIPTGYLPSVVKMYVTDQTMQTVQDAMQIFEDSGYLKGSPVEKLFRDAKIYQIFSGTNQIQRKNIARAIAGRDPEKK